MAGIAAGSNYESYIYTCTNAVAQTSMTFTSQNMGAKKYKNLNKVYFICLGLAFGISVAMGALLSDGIGDTMRISLTDNPVHEVEAGVEILKALKLKTGGVTFVSCPTCGRTQINLIEIANKAYDLCKNIDKDIKIAVMGCVVNGPGEAREADIGIAGGDNCGMLFEKGQQIEKLSYDQLLPALLKRIDDL